jgi:DNA-binding transcriptional LysR family regulator
VRREYPGFPDHFSQFNAPAACPRTIQAGDRDKRFLDQWLGDQYPGAIISRIFGDVGLQLPRASVATLSVQLTTTLIATGKFVGILPNSVASFSARRVGLRILPVKIPDTRYSITIITVKNRTPGPLAKLFVEQARAVAKSLTSPASASRRPS